ncbi:unnamed protein product [Mucor hiemalis]
MEPMFQAQFPAVLTHRSGLSKSLVKFMRPAFQHGVGPHRFAKMLRVMHSERCDVEATKKQYDDTKEKSDSSKLSISCKQMLLNLLHNSPSLQHDLSIVGISVSRLKLTIHELSNPRGVVCVSKIKNELYFPVHMLEWRSKMLDLCEQLWILRMEIEERFQAICTTSKGSAVCTLQPCFQK